jgi:ubiquinone/menaquinone biosynthesis C-methylase UbiE
MSSDCLLFYADIYAKMLGGPIIPIVIQLNIADQLVSSPKSLLEFDLPPSLNRSRLHRFLLQLESLGIFSYNESTNKWSNNTNSFFLSTSTGKGLANWRFSSFMYNLPQNLSDLLYTSGSVYDVTNQPSFFAQVESQCLSLFHSAMQAFSEINSESISNSIVLQANDKILDVGGGNGSLIISLLNHNSSITASILDSAEVCALATARLASANLLHRASCIVGDFFDSVPAGFTAITMKKILHDWPDEQCLQILRNCRRALSPGHKLFIIDIVIDRSSQFYTHQRYMDINMMMSLGSHERDKTSFEVLLSESGFRLVSIVEAVYESVITAEAVE